MSAIIQAFDAVRDMVLAAQSTYRRVEMGALPAADGLCIAISAGTPEHTALDLRGDLSLDIVCNAKHQRQEAALDALAEIHRALTTAAVLPSGTGWQVLSISTSGAPCYLGREEKQWLYGSALNVKLSIE